MLKKLKTLFSFLFLEKVPYHIAAPFICKEIERDSKKTKRYTGMYINMLYLGTIEIITYNLSDNHFTGSIINLLFTKNIDKGVFSINRARFNHFFAP